MGPEKFWDNVNIGKPKKYRNMLIYPLFFRGEPGTGYISLDEALEKEVISITEKKGMASVKEINVENSGNFNVLLLEGEEIMGAKQNRIINTTVLVKKKTKITIPVSCTEAGRWHDISNEFMKTDHLAPVRLRKTTAETVTQSLKSEDSFQSDQNEVWIIVENFMKESNTPSPTKALDEIYRTRNHDFMPYIKALSKLNSGQKGNIVFMNGKFLAMDFISLPEVYRSVYPKLLKSYVMEAMLQQKKQNKTDSSFDTNKPGDFFRTDKIDRYKSPGKGYTCRVHGESFSGSYLTYRNEIIHLALFSGLLTQSYRSMNNDIRFF